MNFQNMNQKYYSDTQHKSLDHIETDRYHDTVISFTL